MHNFSLWSRSDFLRRAAWQQQINPFPVLSWPVIKRFPVSEATFDKLSMVGIQSISPVSPGCHAWWLTRNLACLLSKRQDGSALLTYPVPAPLWNGADPPCSEKKKLLKSWESSGGQPPQKIKPLTGKFKVAKRKAEEIRPDEAGCNPSISTMENSACFRAKITMSKRREWFLPLKFRFFHFVSAKTRSKWAFVRRCFFFSNKKSLGFVKQLLKTCHLMQTEVEIRRDVSKKWKKSRPVPPARADEQWQNCCIYERYSKTVFTSLVPKKKTLCTAWLKICPPHCKIT